MYIVKLRVGEADITSFTCCSLIFFFSTKYYETSGASYAEFEFDIIQIQFKLNHWTLLFWFIIVIYIIVPGFILYRHIGHMAIKVMYEKKIVEVFKTVT